MKNNLHSGPLIVLVLLAILGGLFGCGQSKEIKIGLILPLTGMGKFIGSDLLSGITFAVDETNRSGGVNGRKIRLIVRDCGSDPDRATALFDEIEKSEKPLCYMTGTSTIATRLSGVAEAKEAVLFCLSTKATGITDDKRYVFRYWPQATDEAKNIFKLFDKLKPKNVCILYQDDPFGNSVNDIINSKNSAEGAIYGIRSVPFASAEKDVDARIREVLDADAVFIVGFDTYFKPFIETLERNRYRGVIIGNSAIIISYLRGDFTLDEFYATCPLIYDPNYQFGDREKIAYEAAVHTTFNHYSANGYDMTAILIESVKNRLKIDRHGLRKIMNEGFVHTGVLGVVVVRKGIHDFGFELYPVLVKKGKIIYGY